MKSVAAVVALVALTAFAPASASDASPIEKILEMISDLQAKIIKEGEDAQKTYDSFAEWCEDKSTDLAFEIKTGKADVAESKAIIEEETSTIGALETRIEELSNDIQTDEADLEAATKIRKKEEADFSAEEKELLQVIDMLERATSIISKGGASMLQVKNAASITDALSVMVQASALSSADASRLTTLVQTQQSNSDADSDSDAEAGAPAAAAYESHSGGIVGTLEGLTEKAETQLEKARKTEKTAVQNYQMLKQSLTDAIKFAEKDMDKAKKGKSESEEKKATAEGALEASSKDLAEDVSSKSTLHQDCMSAAEEFELSTKSRGEELKALATAKKVIQETTGGAAGQTYELNQVSLLQVASNEELAKVAAVKHVREVAKQTKSTALAQLASRLSSAMRIGEAAGEDPFAKVKGLITDMISTLESEAEEDASQKAYCDKEMSETQAKHDDLTTKSGELSTKIDQDKASSKKLKEEVATLQNELAKMAKAKAEAEKLRTEEKAAYDKNSAEMKQGIKGVQLALKVLKEYYAKGDKGSSEGAGSGIIGLLEVCESDFSKGLAEMTAEEETAVAEYEAYLKEDEVATVTKQQDVKYKTKEAAGLDKAAAELSTDLTSVTDELTAVTSALDKLKEMCVAKAEPYEERKKRREAEIKGLKEALEILEGETAFIQKASKRTLRGVRAH